MQRQEGLTLLSVSQVEKLGVHMTLDEEKIFFASILLFNK